MRRVLLAALTLLGCTHPGASVRAEDFVEYEPAGMGKRDPPVGLSVRYPLAHPLGVELPMEVDVWSTDGSATALTLEVRADGGVALRQEGKSARFEGPLAAGEKRTHRFFFVPNRRGAAYLHLDAGRQREGDVAHRTVPVPIEGGGRVESPPGGKPPAKPVKLR